MSKIMVWDWPVRIGHWLMAGGFALAWLTSESETFRLVHVVAGATVMAVASFRIVWGFVGSRYARFADFVRRPQTVLAYLLSLPTPRPLRHIGHNPAGGWAILVLLAAALATAGSGWLLYEDVDGHWLEELHEGLAGLMLGVVTVHIAGVVASSVFHRENLVRSMLTGAKEGEEGDAIASVRPLAALLLLAWIVVGSWVVAT